ncbi:MAG TPA: hypothetical protein VN909_05740 [Candidatus Dormibacteraeota bacterium]|nr:hypothetical protein [Candidatus Dormibacteraeota bacterium]
MEGELSEFEKGLILGLLIGEGHFGGDGKQPQITLKMNVRHEQLLMWVNDRVRWSRLYGPYHHDGRHYLQLMIRGPALRQELGPILYGLPWAAIDDHSYGRFRTMLERYGVLDEIVSRSGSP